MPKIAMIGAGSLIFGKTLMADLLSTPALDGAEFALMARTRTRLDKMQAFLDRVVADNGLNATITSTTDRREALRGADYVVVMIRVGGMDAYTPDYQIPLKYGVDQCVGDSMGPGGLFRGLRHIPVLMELAADVRELCPKALVLNYANPMAMCCWALGTTPGLRFVGLCHGVQTTMDLIAGYLDLEKSEIDHLVAGINHMAWFLRIEKDGVDLYPEFRRRCERPEFYVNEKVRIEVMRQFGYFMTESTGHLSEYLPWFRSSRKALDLYCDRPGLGGESGASFKNQQRLADRFSETDPLSIETTALGPRSAEYCSHIIEACETGQVFSFNGNVRNDGYITNLPQGCCVEVPVYADRMGLHPVTVGDLPSQCAALNRTNVTVQSLGVEAAIEGDPERVVQACALDPLTSAVLTLKETRDMVSEMLEAQRSWLPQFEGKAVRPTPTISIPDNIEPRPVPLDPALAVANRFIHLAQACK